MSPHVLTWAPALPKYPFSSPTILLLPSFPSLSIPQGLEPEAPTPRPRAFCLSLASPDPLALD